MPYGLLFNFMVWLQRHIWSQLSHESYPAQGGDEMKRRTFIRLTGVFAMLGLPWVTQAGRRPHPASAVHVAW